MKTCKAYNNLSYIRNAVDKSKPQVAERLKELGNFARASHISHMTETGHDDGYFSEDSIQYEFEKSVPSAFEFNRLQISEDHLIFQLSLLAKMDAMSNKTLKIGSVGGSLLGRRGQGNWKDYVLLNKLFEELKLTLHEGDLVLNSFRRILCHYEVNIFLPSSMRTIKECCEKLTKNTYVYGNEVFHFDNRLVDIADSRYRGALGAFICPLQLLSEFLLTLEDDDLILEVQRKTSSTGKNYIRVY
jgi:hypothetical protein